MLGWIGTEKKESLKSIGAIWTFGFKSFIILLIESILKCLS